MINDPLELEGNIAVPAVTKNKGNDWVHVPLVDVDEREKPLKDISWQAHWTPSSQEDGCGCRELLDDSPDKVWQSNGGLPRTVLIEFETRTDVCFLFLYLDFENDESYTPLKILVATGSAAFFLVDPEVKTFHKHTGWVHFDLRTKDHEGRMRPSRKFVITVGVLENHEKGRETRIRHMRVIGPGKPRFNMDLLTDVDLEPPLKSNLEVNVPKYATNHNARFKDNIIR